jgi:hypothetical protein
VRTVVGGVQGLSGCDQSTFARPAVRATLAPKRQSGIGYIALSSMRHGGYIALSTIRHLLAARYRGSMAAAGPDALHLVVQRAAIKVW